VADDDGTDTVSLDRVEEIRFRDPAATNARPRCVDKHARLAAIGQERDDRQVTRDFAAARCVAAKHGGRPLNAPAFPGRDFRQVMYEGRRDEQDRP
jgi:hypothetical protein